MVRIGIIQYVLAYVIHKLQVSENLNQIAIKIAIELWTIFRPLFSLVWVLSYQTHVHTKKKGEPIDPFKKELRLT